MNMKDEMLNEFDIDLETANRIAKEYPSLSDSARERMFNMTKRKMNITNNVNEGDHNNVHGVEKYSRPGWIKFAGIAAAIAIVTGGIGGEIYLLHKMRNPVPSPDSSTVTEVTATSSATTNVTTTTAVAETTRSIHEEAAHKLTDDYWDYECFFEGFGRPKSNREEDKSIKFNYTMQYGTWTTDIELLYCKTTDERLADKTMDGLKKFYNTYYSNNYDPFYSVNAEYTNNYELFGPSFTADTLPADGIIDHAYIYIEYDGELYQYCPGKGFSYGEHWIDNTIEVSDVTDNSFTLIREFECIEDVEYTPANGKVTFKIVFDEDAQDWRIGQKDIEYEYPDTTT